jgi:hypothetical protein
MFKQHIGLSPLQYRTHQREIAKNCIHADTSE